MLFLCVEKGGIVFYWDKHAGYALSRVFSMVWWRFGFAVAMKATFSLGLRGFVRRVSCGVVIMALASWIMRVAAAMSVVRSLPLMSMKASVVPSAT